VLNHDLKGAPFLLVDAGNNRIKWALDDAGGVRLASGSFAQHRNTLASLPDDWLMLPAPGSVWIANVAGADTQQRIDRLISLHWPQAARCTISAQAEQCGVTNGYRDDQQLGSDRWATLIGARAVYPDENLLIATLGTATTIEVLYENGLFAGGLIMPGRNVMIDALSQHTALLPAFIPRTASVQDPDRRTPVKFATDTQAALNEGCLLAQAGFIERAQQALKTQLDGPIRCLLTGGAAIDVMRLMTITYTHHENLVLTGLACIARDVSIKIC
jgi:type III pantothenate kinase